MTSNKKKYTVLALGAIIATAGAATPASAMGHGENGERGNRGEMFKEMRKEQKDFRKDMRGERNEMRDGRHNAIEKRNTLRNERNDIGKAQRDDFKKELQGYRDDFKRERGEQRDVIKAKLDAATTDEERDTIKDEARATRDEFRNKARDTRTDFRGKAHDARETFRNENKEVRKDFRNGAKDRLKKRLEHIGNRLDGAYARFVKLTERIQDYISKKGDAGADIAAAQTALDATTTAKEAAKTQVAKTKELILTILASDAPKDQIKELRVSIKESVQAIKAANKTMKEAIRAARAIK